MTIVRIKKEWLNESENSHDLYAVVEDQGDCCIIAPVKTTMSITPTESVSWCMLDVIYD